MNIDYEDYVHEWLAGYNALQGERVLNCPYPEKSDEATAWHAGLTKAQRDAKNPDADWCDDPEDPDWYPQNFDEPEADTVDLSTIIAHYTEPRRASNGKWQIHCKLCHQDICPDASWGPRTGVRSMDRYMKYVYPLEERHFAEHLKAEELPNE